MFHWIKKLVGWGILAGLLGYGTVTGKLIIAGCALGIILIIVIGFILIKGIFRKREA
jgi:high-affinity Fe2+/Pb2+ permease